MELALAADEAALTASAVVAAAEDDRVVQPDTHPVPQYAAVFPHQPKWIVKQLHEP